MSSNGTKPAAEMLREVEIEELLARRLQRDRQENRGKRIARIGRLWESRKVLLQVCRVGCSSDGGDRDPDSFAIRIDNAADAAGSPARPGPRDAGQYRGENGRQLSAHLAAICWA